MLHVNVAEEGVAFRRFPVAIRDCEPAVSATVKANKVVPCRLNTEKSIVDHPFYRNVMTTEADERLLSLSLSSISAGEKNTLGTFVF